jgi:hypothetical protein
MLADSLRLHCVREPLRCCRREIPYINIVVLLQLLEIGQNAFCDEISGLLAALTRCASLFQSDYGALLWQLLQCADENTVRFCYVEADVGDIIVNQLIHHRQNGLFNDIEAESGCKSLSTISTDKTILAQSTYGDSKAGRHPVEIVRVLAHSHHLRNNGIIGPLNAENLGQLLQVLGRRLTDREDGVAKPAHAQAAELLIKELYTELRG